MTMLVSDAGLAPDDWKYGYVPLAALAAAQIEGVRLAVDIAAPVLATSEWLRRRSVRIPRSERGLVPHTCEGRATGVSFAADPA